MAWFKMSDDWLDHPKVQRAGKNGRALWVAMGNRCAKYSSDGLIEGDLIKGVAAIAEVPVASTVKKLVEVRLWHDHDTLKNCEDCKRDIAAINQVRQREGLTAIRVEPGDYYWHGWAYHQLSKARLQSPEAKASEDRLKALHKDAQLCRAIQERDGSLCRYCGHRVNWKDRRGDRRATYDHTDPFCYAPNGGNFLEAVVTACGDCNGKKGQRTAEEWDAAGGLPLKPPRWQAGDPWPPPETVSQAPLDLPGPTSGSTPDQIPDPQKPTSGPTPSRVHGTPVARLGPGQVGPGPGVGPGLVGPARFGLGGAGTGQGLVGLGRAGEGQVLVGLGRAGEGQVRVGSAEGAPPPATTEPNVAEAPSATDETQPRPFGGGG